MRKLLYVSLADEYNTILDDAQDNVYAISGIATNSIHLVCIPIIPSILKPCIHALNIVVEKNLQDKQQASLTLDMLYYIASKHPELAPKMRLSPELQEKVSFPMRTATNPTILNRIIHNFLFGNRLLQGAALLGVMGISGLLWYISRQKGITIFPTLRYFAKPVSSSATYRKIVPMYRR
jgi:hypothetical protein